MMCRTAAATYRNDARGGPLIRVEANDWMPLEVDRISPPIPGQWDSPTLPPARPVLGKRTLTRTV